MIRKISFKKVSAVFLIMVLLISTIVIFPRPARADVNGIAVSIEAPKDGGVYYIGDSITIRVSPSIVIYGVTNYAQIEVLKGSKRVEITNLNYTKLGSISTSFKPTTTGTYTIRAGYSPTSSTTMYDQSPRSVTITVVDPQSDIKAIKPVVKAHRFSQTIATLYFDTYTGFNVRIYRSTSKTEGYEYLATVKNTNYYEDTTLTKNKTYYYKIKLQKKIGTKKYYSKFSNASKASYIGLPVLKSLKYVEGTGVKIVWEECAYADVYYVIREEGDWWKEVKKGKTSVYDKTVKPGKTYHYEIKAFNETEQNGKASEVKKIKIPAQ